MVRRYALDFDGIAFSLKETFEGLPTLSVPVMFQVGHVLKNQILRSTM